MATPDDDPVRDAVFEAVEASLDAQLRAVRRLRREAQPAKQRSPAKGRSQVDLAFDVLQRAGKPLHVSELIARVAKIHGVTLDRESIVSALTKKVQRGDRFVRTAPNVFSLKTGGR